MARKNKKKDGQFLIYVAPAVQASGPPARSRALLADDAATRDSIGEVIGKVVKVPTKSVEGQWNKTLDTLMSLTDTVSQRVGKWELDEIEVGLTLSAKGELAFIAEAGAEASIKIVLKPKGSNKGP